MRLHLDYKLVGNSAEIQALRDDIAVSAASDLQVLVTGESGSGKEIIARELHHQSSRRENHFVVVNCTSLADTLLESELFGHVRGAYTDAHKDKKGLVEIAENGTLYLDEVADMTQRLQGLLLRFIETGEMKKVGQTQDTIVDTRIIAATNASLPERVAQGTFRLDLYNRLNVIHLTAPPLREHAADIPELVDALIVKYHSRNNGSQVKSVSDEALKLLMAYKWPGNVRELENLILRLLVLTRSKVITQEHLPSYITHKPSGQAFGSSGPLYERRIEIVENLYREMTVDMKSFWTAVYPLYMGREISRIEVRELVRRGLVATNGSYKILTRLFNMGDSDYKKFLNFLRKHNCESDFKLYRKPTPV